MDIISFIEEEMSKKEMTYDMLAKKIGTSRQNLWMKLNQKKRPNFGTIRKILSGLDIDLIIENKRNAEETSEEDVASFFEIADNEQVSYIAIEAFLSALGYTLKMDARKMSKNVKIGVDRLPTRVII